MKKVLISLLFILILAGTVSCGKDDHHETSGQSTEETKNMSSESQASEPSVESTGEKNMEETVHIEWMYGEDYQTETFELSEDLREFLTDYFGSLYDKQTLSDQTCYIKNLIYDGENRKVLWVQCADTHFLFLDSEQNSYLVTDDFYFDYGKDNFFDHKDAEKIQTLLTDIIRTHMENYTVTEEMTDRIGKELKEKMLLPPVCGMEPLSDSLSEEQLFKLKEEMKVDYSEERSAEDFAAFILEGYGAYSVHDIMTALVISCDEISRIMENGETVDIDLPDMEFYVYTYEQGQILKSAMSSPR